MRHCATNKHHPLFNLSFFIPHCPNIPLDLAMAFVNLKTLYASPHEAPPTPSSVRILLIRHGETVDNVAFIWAGIRDSKLTMHGAHQAELLGQHILKTSTPTLRPVQVFSSDLTRAANTARSAIAPRPDKDSIPFAKTPLLRERDFGPLEGTPFRGETAITDPEPVSEPWAAMRVRAERFIDEHLLDAIKREQSKPTTTDDGSVPCIAVVSHGLFLGTLWAAISDRAVDKKPEYTPHALATPGFYTSTPPPYGNTGYIECDVKLRQEDGKWAIKVHRINEMRHLRDLERTKGGLGSATYDEKQTKISDMFKKA